MPNSTLLDKQGDVDEMTIRLTEVNFGGCSSAGDVRLEGIVTTDIRESLTAI